MDVNASSVHSSNHAWSSHECEWELSAGWWWCHSERQWAYKRNQRSSFPKYPVAIREGRNFLFLPLFPKGRKSSIYKQDCFFSGMLSTASFPRTLSAAFQETALTLVHETTLARFSWIMFCSKCLSLRPLNLPVNGQRFFCICSYDQK